MSQPPSAQPNPEWPGHTLSSQELPPSARPKGSPGGTTTDHIPETFGRYRIMKKLGEGGMGAVYLAQDTQLDRKVALKVPRFEAGAGTQVLERFFREARAAAAFDHPNLCQVYDAGTINGVHYLTMPFIEGWPLANYVKPDKPFQQFQAVEVVRKIALAMAEAHKRGVVHRDLKPANVMINQRGEPVVMDFGLARMDTGEAARLTGAGAIRGTPSYMAPEQVKGEQEKVGPVTDVYALGVILYELLTGRRPFEGPATAILARILIEPPHPVASLRPDVDPALVAVCHKAMAKEPRERFASMEDFAKALTDRLNTVAAFGMHPSGPHLAPPTFPARNQSLPTAPLSNRVSPWLTKRHLASATGAAVLAGVIIWAWIWSRPSGKEPQSPEPPAVVTPTPEKPLVVVHVVKDGTGQYTSVRQAVLEARPGTKILVRPGRYPEVSMRLHQDVEIVGDGPAKDIIIETSVDADGAMVLAADRVVLRNLTVLCQKGPALNIEKGEHRLEGCDLTTRNVDKNTRVVLGMWGDACALLRRCRLHGNPTGTGIWLGGKCRLTLEECEIFDNRWQGIQVGDEAHADIRKCRIHDQGQHGIAFMGKGTGIVEDCDILGNAHSGVTFWDNEGETPVVRNCRVNRNLHAGIGTIGKKASGKVEDCDLTGNVLGAVVINDGARVERRNNKE